MSMRKTIEYIILFMFYCIAKTAFSCDMSAFDQNEFSKRCQRLIDYCQKAYISIISNHPDTEKRLNEVSKDWIDFYLSHGKKDFQPPNMAFIDSEIWEIKLNELGFAFNDFIHKKINEKSFQKIVLKLSLLKDEEKLSQLHNSFKIAELCETDLSKIEDLNLWLETKLIIPYSFILSYEENLSSLVFTLNLQVNEHIEAVERFKKVVQDSNKSLAVRQSMFNLINKSISQTLIQWETDFFYK